MATFANLVVQVKANTSKAKAELNNFSGTAKKTLTAAAAQAAKLAKVFSVAMVAAIGASIAAVNKFSKGIDELAKTAKRLGASVEDIQALQFAMEKGGISTTQFNLILQRMVRRLGEAANGTGEAVKALDQLNLDAKELVKLPIAEQFIRIRKALDGVSNANERVALGFKFFDSEGVKALQTTTAEIQNSISEFERFGLTLTSTQTAAVERFQDLKTSASTVFSAFGRQVSAEVAPAFSAVLESVKQSIVEMGGLKEVAQAVASTMVSVAQTIIRSMRGIGAAINAVTQSFKAIQLNRLENQIQSASDNIAKRRKLGLTEAQTSESGLNLPSVKEEEANLARLKAQAKALVEQEEAYRNSTSVLRRAEEALDNYKNKTMKASTSNVMLNDASVKASVALNKVAESAEQAATTTQQAASAYRDTLNEILGIGKNSNIQGLTEEGRNDPTVKLIEALRQDRANGITQALPTFNLLDKGLPAGAKNFGSGSFGDGKSPLDGVIRNGANFTDQQTLNLNLMVTTDNNIIAAEVVNSDQFKNGTINVMQEAARNDKR